MDKLRFTYSNYRSGDYGHPTITVYLFDDSCRSVYGRKLYHLGSELFTITWQTNAYEGENRAYAPKIELACDYNTEYACKLVSKLVKHRHSFKALYKALLKAGAVRYTHINSRDAWIPRKYLNHSDLYINAYENGLTLKRKAA